MSLKASFIDWADMDVRSDCPQVYLRTSGLRRMTVVFPYTGCSMTFSGPFFVASFCLSFFWFTNNFNDGKI